MTMKCRKVCTNVDDVLHAILNLDHAQAPARGVYGWLFKLVLPLKDGEIKAFTQSYFPHGPQREEVANRLKGLRDNYTFQTDEESQQPVPEQQDYDSYSDYQDC